MGLRGYIIKRIIYTVILVLAVLVLNFFIFEAMPNSALQNYVTRPGLTKAAMENLEAAFGLGKPWYVKFPTYIKSMLTFNFGYTDMNMGMMPVENLIWGRVENTLLLMGVSSIIAVIAGILIGAYAAHERG